MNHPTAPSEARQGQRDEFALQMNLGGVIELLSEGVAHLIQLAQHPHNPTQS